MRGDQVFLFIIIALIVTSESCRYIPPEPECPWDQYFSTLHCRCMPRDCFPPIYGCPEGQKWNQKTCQCQTQFCFLPKQWDHETNSCQCLNRKFITCQFGFDNQRCDCIFAPRCILPKQWDHQTNTCECLNRKYIKCGFGYNQQICNCFSQPPCQPPKVWYQDRQQCRCQDYIRQNCLPWQIFDEGSCTCISSWEISNLRHHY